MHFIYVYGGERYIHTPQFSSSSTEKSIAQHAVFPYKKIPRQPAF
jgi:hypothetical protein